MKNEFDRKRNSTYFNDFMSRYVIPVMGRLTSEFHPSRQAEMIKNDIKPLVHELSGKAVLIYPFILNIKAHIITVLYHAKSFGGRRMVQIYFPISPGRRYGRIRYR